MRVHHLNCGTMCPIGAKAVNGTGGLFEAGRMVCHCLLVETDGARARRPRTPQEEETDVDERHG